MQETEIDETVDDGLLDCTETEVCEDTAGFWRLVAVTVTFPPEEGAVKRPLAVIVPALADHFTSEL